MKRDIVKNAVICLSHLEIEDTTYKIARDIVIEEYEQQKEEIERLNNIINELEEYIKPFLYMLNGITDRDVYEQCQLDDFTMIMDKLQELKGDSSNE